MSARWSPFIKQVVIIGMIVALIWLLLSIRVLLGPLVLALLLAYLVSFPVRWVLRHTGWPRTPVVAVTYLLVLVFFITAPVVLIPRLVSLLSAFGATIVNVVRELSAATPPKPISLTPSLTLDPGIFYAPINQWLRSVLEPDISGSLNPSAFLFPFASGAAIVVRSAVSSVLWIFFILVISFYVAKDGPSIGRWLSARLPEQIRPELQRLAREFSLIWDAFVRGQVILAAAMGVIVWLAMGILGIGSAPALGLLSGLAEFIPGVGPVSAAAVGVLIALILGSSWLPMANEGFAVIVALVYFLLSQFENLYLVPRVVGRRISLHPVVVIVGALIGAQVGGVLGLLLAAPTIASIRTLFGYAAHKLLDEEPFPPSQPVPDRRLVWQDLVRTHEACAVLFDLDGTLIETNDLLIERLAQWLSPLRRVLPNVNLVRMARRIFMLANLLANRLVTLLELLRLNHLLYRMDDRLRALRGVRSQNEYLAVPGSIEMLRWLAKRYRLAVVTSRPRGEALVFLSQYGLVPLFRGIVTRDDVARLKPHPLALLTAAAQLGVQPEQCVMVGDTSMDMRAARSAGMLCIGVLSGFGEENDLDEADLLISSTAQLGAWL